MARVRAIHPKIWTDESFVELSDKAKILILALGTFSDYADRFDWNETLISSHCGMRSNVVSECLVELEAWRMISRDGRRGEILFAFGFRRRRISKWESVRSAVFERDNYTCQYCGSTTEPLHCDHVVPQSRGGSSEIDNLKTACAPCNLSKHDRTPEEWLRVA